MSRMLEFIRILESSCHLNMCQASAVVNVVCRPIIFVVTVRILLFVESPSKGDMPVPRKRRWGSSSHKESVAISSESLKV